MAENSIPLLENETKYSPSYIYRSVFGSRMKGHHQYWPDINFDELIAINPDTIGWIHMDLSPVNYPILRGHPSQDYYLKYNFSGEVSDHGGIAMDYRNHGRIGERTTILIGHHMRDCSMFFSISRLFSQKYYENYKGLDILMRDGMYRVDFFAANLISPEDRDAYRINFESDEDYGNWLAERQRRALYKTPVVPTVKDRVIILCTCYFDEDPKCQYHEIAVYGIIRKIKAEEIPLDKHIQARGKAPEILILTNLWNKVPENYRPQLVSMENGMKIDGRCYEPLMEMIKDCRRAGGTPYIISAYRTLEEQRKLFEERIDFYRQLPEVDDGIARGMAAWSVSVPGTSDHELGLSVDISDSEDELREEDSFTSRWLAENAWHYGFILRYPRDKEDVTGIFYEPWHFRYVGKKHAEEIYKFEITLEEYLALFYDDFR